MILSKWNFLNSSPKIIETGRQYIKSSTLKITISSSIKITVSWEDTTFLEMYFSVGRRRRRSLAISWAGVRAGANPADPPRSAHELYKGRDRTRRKNKTSMEYPDELLLLLLPRFFLALREVQPANSTRGRHTYSERCVRAPCFADKK